MMVNDPFVTEFTVYNVYGSTVKPRPSGRGSSRRGRPRGSRSRTPGVVRNFSSGPSTSSTTLSTSAVFSGGRCNFYLKYFTMLNNLFESVIIHGVSF